MRYGVIIATRSPMVLVRATRRLLKGAAISVADSLPPDVEPLGEWYANSVSLPAPGRWLVLFTSADTLVSVVAPGRSLRTTLPVFERRMALLLRRLGLPEPWVQARADAFGEVHVVRAGAQTADRRVLGTMTDLAYLIRAEAKAAGSFERLDLDRVEERLAEVPLSVLGYGHPTQAIAELAGA